MADHTIIPANAHGEIRTSFADEGQFPHDVAGGDLDIQKDTKLPKYWPDRELESAPEKELDREDVSDEDLATLRRVADSIPLSAWYLTASRNSLTTGSSSSSSCASGSPFTD
jgi:hypothetical protein